MLEALTHIKCKQCGVSISNQAKSCPHCGNKVTIPMLSIQILGLLKLLVRRLNHQMPERGLLRWSRSLRIDAAIVARSARAVVLGVILAIPCIASARGYVQYDTHSQSARPNEDGLIEHGHYTNKRGQDVHSPAHSLSGGAPTGATAKCGDGSYSFSQSHRGTCSRHGGVREWL